MEKESKGLCLVLPPLQLMSGAQCWRCLGSLSSPFCSTCQFPSSCWIARETLARVGTSISSGRAEVAAQEAKTRGSGWVSNHRTQALGSRCDLIPLKMERLNGTASASPFFSFKLNST